MVNWKFLAYWLLVEWWKFFTGILYFKEHKCCHHINKSRFLTLPEEGHLHDNIDSRMEPCTHHRSLVFLVLRKPDLKKQTLYLRDKLKQAQWAVFLCESQHFCTVKFSFGYNKLKVIHKQQLYAYNSIKVALPHSRRLLPN